MGAVAKVNIYVTNMSDYSAVNDVYRTFFATGDPPARACVAVPALPGKDAKIMIDCIAAKTEEAAAERSVVRGNTAVPVYSPAVVVGETVYASGQVALDPKSTTKSLVGAGDVGEETKQALTNLEAVLRKADCGLANVSKVTIYLTNMCDYAKVNEVYKTFFKEEPPARACFAVGALPLGAKVEIEAVGRRSSSTSKRRVVAGSTAVPVYSPAIIHGSTAYVSGQVALLRGGVFDNEARDSFSNLKTVLHRAGASLEGVAKVNAFLKDGENFEQVL